MTTTTSRLTGSGNSPRASSPASRCSSVRSRHMAGILEGKVALITGAGSGIGRATSKIFAREGAKLVLADVVEDGGKQTLALLADTGHHDAIFIKTDVSNPADVDAAIAKAVEKYGRIDCAFNNAGIEGKNGLTHECDMDNWNRVIA